MNDAPPFAAGNAGRRTAKAGVAAQADFDEHHGFAVLRDQIDFAAAAAHLACKHAHAAVAEKARRQGFGGIAARLRAGGRGIDNRALQALEESFHA